MNADRRLKLWRLLVETANGRPVGIQDVCAMAIRVTGVDSAAVTVLLSATPRETLYASDQVASELEELTLTVGEGPCVDAFAGGPALVADLTSLECLVRWPAYAPAAVDAGIRAVFALPLQIGAIRLGMLDLYRGGPGELARDQLTDALMLADTACSLLLDEVDRDGQDTQIGRPDRRRPSRHRPYGHRLGGSGLGGRGLDGHEPAGHRSDGREFGGGGPERTGLQHPEVHQATGMMTVQLGVTAAVALIRMRAYAYSHGRRLRDVAGEVVARTLRFNTEDGRGSAEGHGGDDDIRDGTDTHENDTNDTSDNDTSHDGESDKGEAR